MVGRGIGTGRTRARSLGMRGCGLVLSAVVVLGGCSGSEGEEAEAGGEDTLDLEIPESDAPEIISPDIGDEVPRTFTVEIDPGPIDVTGETVEADAGGMFHLLVDQDCLDNGDSFPEPSDTHVVIPSGETEAQLELEPGAHEICLQFGNLFDVAFYATDTVTITVR